MEKTTHLLIFLIILTLLSGCKIITPGTPPEPTVTVIEPERYELIVIGSDPEGIAAAVSAARNNVKTLLLDNRSEIGGLMTLGWLNFLDMNYTPDNILLTQGIFKEFYDQLPGVAFDLAIAEEVFANMTGSEENLTVKLDAANININVENNIITGVDANIQGKTEKYTCHYLIDASQNGDFAASVGAPFSLGQTEIGGPSYGMAVTQIFSLKGITPEDWHAIRLDLKNDNDPNTGSTNNTAWGYWQLYRDYKPHHENVQLRGLNIARSKDYSLMINALQIFAIDPLDEASKNQAKEIAKLEIEYIIQHLRENITGMQNVELESIAPELYIREARHFHTLYRLTLDDVLEHRNFPDKIAWGSYPVDLQGTAPGQDVIILGNPAAYSIPIRSAIFADFPNLLIAGKSAGYDCLAHGSARVLPIGMAVGEALGVAVAEALEQNLPLTEAALDEKFVTAVQNRLRQQGAFLEDLNFPAPITKDKAYEGVKLLRHYGLIQGRYTNDYGLGRKIDEAEMRKTYDSLREKISRQNENAKQNPLIPSVSPLPELQDLPESEQYLKKAKSGKMTLGELAMFCFRAQKTGK